MGGTASTPARCACDRRQAYDGQTPIVPRQSGTGGKVRLLGIAAGDPYLRTLLIHGARAVLTHGSRPGRTVPPWLQGAAVKTTQKWPSLRWPTKSHERYGLYLAHDERLMEGRDRRCLSLWFNPLEEQPIQLSGCDARDGKWVDREEVSLNGYLDFESLKEMRPSSADIHQGHAEPTLCWK